MRCSLIFKSFKAMAEKQIGLQLKCIRSDGGGEYFCNEFSNYLSKNGIQREFTCRYTLQQNGVAERNNRHVAEIARVLMYEKSMPHSYWAEAMSAEQFIL